MAEREEKERNFGRSRRRAVQTTTTNKHHQQAPTGTNNRHQQAPTGTNRQQPRTKTMTTTTTENYGQNNKTLKLAKIGLAKVGHDHHPSSPHYSGGTPIILVVPHSSGGSHILLVSPIFLGPPFLGPMLDISSVVDSVKRIW